MKEVTEYKDKFGGPELGEPQMERNYFSPKKGVPIREGEGNPRQMIREMEKRLGISSWIDNF